MAVHWEINFCKCLCYEEFSERMFKEAFDGKRLKGSR